MIVWVQTIIVGSAGAHARWSGAAAVYSGAVPEVIDADLLRRAQHDDAAFRQIQDRFVRLLWATSANFGLDRSTREDIVQLVWLKLFQHLGRIRQPERLAGWLASTTRNECLRMVKARSRIVLTHAVERADHGDEGVDAALMRHETVQAVSEALASLGRSCQELLRLLAEDPPPSYQAISAALGMPVPSIGPTRQRCLRNLARHPRIVSITGRVPGSFTAGASDQHEGGAR